MTSEELNYINDLVFGRLAQHESVKIDNFGTLKCTLESANGKANQAPKYEVNFTKEDTESTLLSETIAKEVNCAPKEAVTMVTEWLEGLKIASENTKTYDIAKVGVISIVSESESFKCSDELTKLLQPLTETTTVKTDKTEVKKEDKKRMPIIAMTASILACFAIIFLNKCHNTCCEAPEPAPVIDTIEVVETTTDSLEVKPEQLSEEGYPKGYYVITNTFREKENAETRLKELSKDEKGAVMMTLKSHSITPYFVAMGRFDTLEEARKVVNSFKYDEAWILGIGVSYKNTWDGVEF